MLKAVSYGCNMPRLQHAPLMAHVSLPRNVGYAAKCWRLRCVLRIQKSANFNTVYGDDKLDLNW